MLRPLIDAENAALSRISILRLFASVSEDQETREASRAAEKLVLEAENKALVCERMAKLVGVVWKRREGLDV